ncbi:FAD:protein FMN transferase [Undibacterium sp. Ji50W]|uniref:FAD:protein FMN transferase n=1 Tax=Undibacterium sp. Ji50W TaxID=3413041 RepID=UPI003BF30E87
MKRRAQPGLGTLVEISLYDDLDELQSRAAFQAGFAAIHDIHRLMSFHMPDSDISRYNRAAVGKLLKINTHTAKVLITARHMHQVSDGLFDIRVARRLVEWEYLPTPAPLFSSTRSSSAAEMYDVSPDGEIEKCSDDWLDLGGIAKGYAVDCSIAALQACGVQHACVNAGGDLRVLGRAQTVLIRDPHHPQSAARQMQLADRAMATSASYFSRKDKADKVLSALVHPLTGKAIVDQHSYTVVAPNCVSADALTKVIATSGDAQHPCLRLYDAEAFII